MSYSLNFANGIIEHLGVRLYQNKPTKVIAEYVSNSWDADASECRIQIPTSSLTPDSSIVITDDGVGMSENDLKNKFLVIGLPKRKSANSISAGKQRKLMGRKGIGKLAGFGVADRLEVLTCSKTADNVLKCYWLQFELSGIISSSHDGLSGKYEAKVLADGVSPEEFEKLLKENDPVYDDVRRHLEEGSSFTSIILTGITLKRKIETEKLKRSLANRLGSAFDDHKFSVYVQNERVVPSAVFPKFHDFNSLGDLENPKSDTIHISGHSYEVKYWVKFVSLNDSEWPIENSGVGIYAHNKIIQDRPFFFENKGQEISSRYLYACVYADWLDEQEKDLVSTDRSSLNWENPFARELMKWGQKKIKEWLKGFSEWKKERAILEVNEKISKSQIGKTLSLSEVNALTPLLSEIFPKLGNDEEGKVKAINALTSVWINKPARNAINQLWVRLSAKETFDKKLFPDIVESLVTQSIPEAINLAVMVSQRIGAINSVEKFLNEGSNETSLQKLIEGFPWILGPEWEKLIANESLKTLIKKQYPEEINQLSDSQKKKRPDFVYLSSGDEETIVVIELKGAELGKTLLVKEYRQLRGYLDAIADVKTDPETKIKGILIGHEKGGFKEDDNRIETRTWDEVLNRTKRLHISYLEALLRFQNDLSPDNERVMMMREFGGSDVSKIIDNLDRLTH